MKQFICGNAVKFERNEDCPRKKNTNISGITNNTNF